MPEQTTLTCYCTALREATRRMTQFYDGALAPTGVGVAQFALLRALVKAEGPTITEFSRDLGLERSTISRNLRVLARKKLVQLEVYQEDLRASAIAITPEGREVLARAEHIWAEAQKFVQSALGVDEANRLLALLEGIRGRHGIVLAPPL